MFNSVLSEIFVLKTIKVKIIKEFIVEAVMTVGFILCASLLSLWIGMAVYVALFAAYCLFNYKLFVSLFKRKGKTAEVAQSEQTTAEQSGEPTSVQAEERAQDKIDKELDV